MAASAKAVVNVGAQSLQRDFAQAVAFASRHFGAGKPPGAENANSLGPELHGAGHGLAHGALVSDALGDLLRDAFRDKLSIKLGMADFGHVDQDFALSRDFAESVLQDLRCLCRRGR